MANGRDARVPQMRSGLYRRANDCLGGADQGGAAMNDTERLNEQLDRLNGQLDRLNELLDRLAKLLEAVLDGRAGRNGR
jgi:hypothetical protein